MWRQVKRSGSGRSMGGGAQLHRGGADFDIVVALTVNSPDPGEDRFLNAQRGLNDNAYADFALAEQLIEQRAVASLKPLFDAMVAAGIVADDSIERIPNRRVEVVHAKGQSKIRMTFTELEPPDSIGLGLEES